LRGPFLYIAAAILIVTIGFSFLGGTGFREITTQEGLQLLKTSRVESAQIHDGEQRVDLILSTAGTHGKNVQFYYAWPRGEEVVNTVTNAGLKSFDDKVTNPNWFTSMLGLLIPFLIIGVIFWFLFRSMQG